MTKNIRIKTNVKAGGLTFNHNQATTKSIQVKTNVKAGGLTFNHNQTAR